MAKFSSDAQRKAIFASLQGSGKYSAGKGGGGGKIKGTTKKKYAKTEAGEGRKSRVQAFASTKSPFTGKSFNVQTGKGTPPPKRTPKERVKAKIKAGKKKTGAKDKNYIVSFIDKSGKVTTKTFTNDITAGRFAYNLRSTGSAKRLVYGRAPAGMSVSEAVKAAEKQITRPRQ